METLASGSIDLKSLKVAGQTATNFLSADSSGIMIYDGSNGEQSQSPSNPDISTNNVFIDSNSLDIRKGIKVLATFSADGVNIGEESATSRAKFSAAGFEVEDDTLLTVVKIGKGETLSNHYIDEHNGRVHWYDNYFLMRSWNNGIKMESPIGEIKFSIPWAKYDQSNTLADSGTLTFQFDEGVEETQYDSTNSVRVYYSGTDYITYHIDGDAYCSYMRDYCGEGNLYSTTERQLWSVNQDYVNYNGYSGMFVHIEGGFRNSTRTFSMNFAIPEGLLPSAGHKEMVAQTAVGEYTIKGYVQAVGTTSYKITFKAWGNEWGYPYVKDTSYMMIRPHNVLFPNGTMKVDYYGTSEAPYYSFGQRSEGLYGAYSFAIGQELIAEHPRALVTGKFNDDDESYAFQIGNGEDDNNRANIFTIDWDGNVAIPNNLAYKSKNLSGDERRLCYISTTNGYIYGYDSYNNNEGGSYLYGNTIGVRSKGAISIGHSNDNNTIAITGATSITGGLNITGQYQRHGNTYIVTDSRSKDNVRVPGTSSSDNSYVTITVTNIDKDGYTPIAVVNYNFQNATTNGSNSSNIMCYGCSFDTSDNTASVKVRNLTSSDARIKVTVRILYRAN